VFQAVHSDRSGRVFVAADYGAAGLDGGTPAALERAVPLPPGAEIVPLADRAAVGIDRRGLPRSLGAARWAVAAILPPGHVRTHVPAVDAATGAAPLEPLAYAAVAADERGELVVAAVAIGEPPATQNDDLGPAITRRLGTEPSNRLLRQLARCAREYRCPAARDAFRGDRDCPLPLGAPANDEAAPLVALRRRDERAPLEPTALRVSASDAAAVAIAHLAGGGASVSFGHACEGDPLGLVRDAIDATTRIKRDATRGIVTVRTTGGSATAIGRLAEAGVDRVAVRLASADGPTYERVHRPTGYRWSDVRAGLREAARRRLAITVELLLLPGLTDRATELDALLPLLGELPEGTELRLAELACDPYAVLARSPGDAMIGIAGLIDRIHAEASHIRLAA
jgi:hypothetical protein